MNLQNSIENSLTNISHNENKIIKEELNMTNNENLRDNEILEETTEVLTEEAVTPTITTEMIVDGAVTLNKLGDDVIDEVVIANLFSTENVFLGIINQIIDESTNIKTFPLSKAVYCKVGYIPCEKDTTYTIRLNGSFPVFSIGTTTEEIDTIKTTIENNGVVEVDKVIHKPYSSTFTYKVESDAKYILFYYYHPTYCSLEPEVYAKNIFIVKGEDPVFENIKVLKSCVLPKDYQGLPDKIIELEASINTINNTLKDIDKELPKDKIYGVTFNETAESSECTRIEDAIGLQTDYVVGNTYKNGGKNDFDSIYPWCEIRRCNLTVDKAGNKTVIYEGEAGFTTTEANVMVEIPKFYTKREKVGTVETWALTGKKKDGFTIEPAFLDNEDNELDHIYVGAYEFTNIYTSNGYCHSISNNPLLTAVPFSKYREKADDINMTCMDYATLHALQFLFVIEFADTNTDKFMQGVSKLPFDHSTSSPIVEFSNERKTVKVKKEKRIANLRVGQQIKIVNENNKIYNTLLTIESIVDIVDDLSVQITFNNAVNENLTTTDENANVPAEYYIVGAAQNTGTCDTLPYHTGRVGEDDENSFRCFRYRYIENIWGNAWTMLEGIRVKTTATLLDETARESEEDISETALNKEVGNYYYTFDPSYYGYNITTGWINSNLTPPLQENLGEGNKGWITSMGYNASNSQIMLPTSVSIDDENKGWDCSNKHYSSALYTKAIFDKSNSSNAQKTEYFCVYGGGYDHNTLCGLFTMRFWWYPEHGEKQSLHSTRLAYRFTPTSTTE